ncbi:coenzyme F430 synthase [Methanobacterium paludis]|uniref:Mur ligase middle domain protein n=1 Tax=Methanobacterium paludis (strain DSM 25820 / JCM 18151 / SWAN1) TaxID=868131 RepID=F6D2Z7_METPW|nr:coenzyme F430 synthase [Methanobacterium paludis]AEG17360.1 Mur ligase middle domain protein [Methanobacterium paludis]
MKVLVVDMTHGGTIIASEFSKLPGFEVFALDIYKTLKEKDSKRLMKNGVKLVEEDFLEELMESNERSGENEQSCGDEQSWGNESDKIDLTEVLTVVSPVHCDLESKIGGDNGRLMQGNIKRMTHHEAVGFLLKNRIDVPVIEITGVKGKTSVVWMLKEIFKDSNPLVLSSLGVEILKNEKGDLKHHFLKKNISITPASILESFNLVCNENPHKNGVGCENANCLKDVGICIFETSLGGTGLADVGILTNIAEDYPIANRTRKASQAKAQIFKSKMVVCDFDSFISIYRPVSSNYDSNLKTHPFNLNLKEHSNLVEKTNTFGLEDGANVKAFDINLGLYETTFQVEVKNLKTGAGKILNTSFEISTFAPAPYHVQNVLSVICACLTIETPIETIKLGLKNFRGLKGRTSIKKYKGSVILEEINPGLNVTALKKAVDMVKDVDDVGVIFGGKYGVTCEEIDESTAANVLNKIGDVTPLMLVDELGNNIKNIIKRNFGYIVNLNDAIDHAVDMGCRNILVIYRSNFSDTKKR